MAGEKNIICPLCNCTSAKIYDSVKEWKLMKCSQCDFVFTHPLPMENEMKGFYDEKYFTDALHKEKYFSALR